MYSVPTPFQHRKLMGARVGDGRCVTWCQPEQPGRNEVEAFIRRGFDRHHGASIRHFMPTLLAINDGSVKAALGVRLATAPLFIEQYLDGPIERLLDQYVANRAHIAEIGNLVSEGRQYTLTLFLITALAMHRAGIEHLVFCATTQVADILRRAGTQLTPIVVADGRRIGASLAHWGRYYDHQPTVMHLGLAAVAALIDASPLLRRLCDVYRETIDDIAQHIQLLKGTSTPNIRNCGGGGTHDLAQFTF